MEATMSAKKKKSLIEEALPYQKALLHLLEGKKKIVIASGHNAGKTIVKKCAALKHLIELGKVKFPSDGDFYKLMKEHSDKIDALLGIPKELMVESKRKHSTAVEVRAMQPPMQPPPLGSHIALNIVTFDRYHGQGWKLNLITREYEHG